MQPWSFFVPKSAKKGRDMGDIEFLAIKESEGKLVTNEGTLSAVGDLATLTASSGKDMYLGKAKVSARLEASAGGKLDRTCIVELQVNGVVKATYSCEFETASGGQGADTSENYEFVVSGLKVAATEIIKLRAATVDADVEVNGELVCFEETTGASPQIPSI